MNYAKDITSEYTASYAKYVAISRAVPSLVDGLKPVHRRCINSADDLKIYHDRKFLKVSKLEGQVMGDYHPHGGANMSLLAQPFKTRYPLFEGQGNFGSPDEPDSVAAPRYIETRLTKFCEDFYLSSSDYADREDNYDGRLKEVVRYYPPIPGVLLTGASGIAVGFSTNIPPHKISDVCKSLLSYIKDPDNPEYMNMMPETCEESIILTSKEEIKDLYKKGECSIRYKAKTHYESIEGKLALVVDAFPPDYSKKRLETSFILDAVESGDLELRNESSTGIRYVFLSNNKSILSEVENRLESSTGYRMYIEHDGRIHLYNLKEIYDHFLEAKIPYIRRKYKDLASKHRNELEFIRVLVKLKEDKNYIRTMFDKSPSEVVEDIMNKYSTSKDIASRIISSSLSSMMKDNVDKLLLKSKKLMEELNTYESYVADPMTKIILDIEDLYREYESEERRANHIEDISDLISFEYNDEVIKTTPSALFYVAKKDNTYKKVHAADLVDSDLSELFIVSADYEYYVFYDSQGLVAVTQDTMRKLDSKFKSDHLTGLVGTNDLTELNLLRSNTKKIIPLGDWAIRSRLSYIRQVENPHTIKITVN